MTSEVVVMNRLAVALAADSAATITGGNSQKIWNSANKLFALSKCHPVGVMVYNNASLLGIPWETIIKTYRAQLEKKGFNTLEEYGSDFFQFLNGNQQLFPREAQIKYFKRQFAAKLDELRKRARQRVFQAVLSATANPGESTFFENVVDEELAQWEGRDDLATNAVHTEAAILAELDPHLDEPINAETKGLTVEEDLRGKLKRLAVLLIIKNEFEGAYTGVVFAGFGDAEHFPVLQYFQVGGVILDHLKISSPTVERITDETPSIVTPFAQSQMVDTFLEGISPALRHELVQVFIGLATQLPETVLDAVTDLTDPQKDHWKTASESHARDAIKAMLEKLKEYRYERHWAPVHAALIHLPKDELANVAEALVNLNSFQKRVSMEDETVGGPIDVAVISKGDGLIWIKRKHYFSRELNERYFHNHVNV